MDFGWAVDRRWLGGGGGVGLATVLAYSKSASLIRNAVLIDILSRQGYDIINYSIFDLKGHPAITEGSMLPVKTKLITGRTLSSVLLKDIGWMRARYFPSFARDMMQVYRINNNKFIELVSQFAIADRKNPAFVYAHQIGRAHV